MLMRAKKTYTIPVSSELQHTIGAFQDALDEGDQYQAQEHLHCMFMCLWKQKWKPTADNLIPCPTIRALALMTLHPDGHFAEPHHVMGLIAKWERCMRLAFVKEIIALSESAEEEEACSMLQPWFTEKSHCPFNSLRSLQHRASAIAKSTMGLGRVLWVDRVDWTSFLYQGTRISLDQMIKINRAIEDKLIDAWEGKVLLGLKVRVEYSNIVENLGNTDVGYSFLTDPRNDTFKQQDCLLLAILEDPVQYQNFVQLNPQTSAVIWNKSSLRLWLLHYGDFQKLALTRCEILAGGPGRSTEFTGMQQHNTEDRNTRSINILDTYVAIVRQYHKSSQLTGQDTFIPHALDGVMSDLIIQDLALAKPFAQFATHICVPDRPDIQELYRDYLFINNTQLFTVESITEVIKDHTVPVLGISLGIRDWCHVAIAFKQKLCTEAMELYEGSYSGDTISVRQAGHSRVLEDRMYGLSPDALLGVAEDLLPLFMASSTKWQTLHKAVPGEFCACSTYTPSRDLSLTDLPIGGLMLPYPEARSTHFDDLVNKGVIKLASPSKGSSSQDHDAIVDKVVDRLKPFLESLIKDSIQSAMQEIMNQPLLPNPHPAHALLVTGNPDEPIAQAHEQEEDDDNWESMFLDIPPLQPFRVRLYESRVIRKQSL